MKTQSKTDQTTSRAGNTGDQVLIDFSVATDWLKKKCKFSTPITEQSKAKTKQQQIFFNTQLEIALNMLKY